MDNVLFRQSFMGFDRRQVLDYISVLSVQADAKAKEREQLQKSLEEQIADLTGKLEQAQKDYKVSEMEKRRIAEELIKLKSDSDGLKKQVSEYRNAVFEKNRELAQIKKELSRSDAEKRRLAEENRQWKEKQDRIAACMVEASARAEKIVRRAQRQAERTKAQLDSNAGRLMDKVADMKNEISQLEKQLESSFEKLSVAMKNMDTAATNIESQVQQYHRQVRRMDEGMNFSIPSGLETESTYTAAGEKFSPRKTLTETVLETISKLLDK